MSTKQKKTSRISHLKQYFCQSSCRENHQTWHFVLTPTHSISSSVPPPQLQVFKSTNANNDGPHLHQTIPSCAAITSTVEEKSSITKPMLQIYREENSTLEIYKIPTVTAIPLRRKESTHLQLLDIPFPPWIANPAIFLQVSKYYITSLLKKLLQYQLERQQPQQKARNKTSLLPSILLMKASISLFFTRH